MGRSSPAAGYPRTTGADDPGDTIAAEAETATAGSAWRRLQNVTNGVAWVALGLAVLTAFAFVVTSGVMFSREARRYALLNERTHRLQEWVELCHCDTFFSDDAFMVLSEVEPSKRFQFSAKNITLGAKRTYTMPNRNGILALQPDVDDAPPPAFGDDAFTVFNIIDNTKLITFDVSSIGAATTRTYVWPNKGGTVALISDISALLSDGSNSSEFLDSKLVIRNEPDTTKAARFDTAAITTAVTRTYIFPDKSGVLALRSDTVAAAVPSTFQDSIFTIENADDPSKKAMFDGSAITNSTTRTFVFPNADGTLALNFLVDGFYAERSQPRQRIPARTLTSVLFDDDGAAALGNNPGGNYDTTTGTYTVPARGFYDISYHLEWTVDNSHSEFMGRILIDSPSRSVSLIRLLQIVVSDPVLLVQPSDGGTMLHIELRSGDMVVVQCFQTSGTNRFIQPGSLFSVTRVG